MSASAIQKRSWHGLKTVLFLVGSCAIVVSVFGAQPTTDAPIPFGYKMAWYAVRTTNAQAVAETLNLKSQHPANWKEGYKEAYGGEGVFVSPPVSGWVFVVGTPIFPDLTSADKEKCLTRLKVLSERFGEAQLFATHRGVSSHAWAKAVQGSLSRAFGYNGDQGQDVWNVGKETEDEVGLGFKFSAGKEPDEEDVMKLAGRWSVNPQHIDSLRVPPALGIIGKL